MGGVLVFYPNTAMMWKCSKLKLVADSTAYTEMSVQLRRRTRRCRCALPSRRSTMLEWGPTPLIGNNKAMRNNIVKSGSSTRIRHFEFAEMAVKCFYQLLIIVPSG